MKKSLIWALMLLAFFSVQAGASGFKAVVPDTTDAGEILVGTSFTIDFYGVNDDGGMLGASVPFALYSPDVITTITHVNVSGISPYIPPTSNTWEDSSITSYNGWYQGGDGFWSMFADWSGWSWDGTLPDTVNFSGITLSEWAISDTTLYFQFHIQIDQEGTFCVDSIDHDNNTYDWLFDYPVSFGGPYCWSVVGAAQTADLALTNLAVSPSSVTTREFTSCSFDIVNNGPSDLSSEYIQVNFYLSDDETFGDADDVKIGDAGFTVSISNGGTYPITLSSTGLSNMVRFWPEDHPCGDYYVFASVIIVNPPPTDPNESNDYDWTISTINYHKILTAGFDADVTSGSYPLTVQFTDLSTGCTIISWLWDFGDGGTSTEQNPMHTYTDPGKGTYTVTLTVDDGTTTDSDIKTDYISGYTDVKEIDRDLLPTEFGLGQNYPNPFNMQTNFEFALPEQSSVNISIYNVIGQKIKTLADGELEAGYYEVSWDGTSDYGVDVASGLYFYKMETEKFKETRKLMLLK